MGKIPKIIAKDAQLTINALGQKGDGIARWGKADESVYIDGALQGEVVRASLSRGNDNILRGKITDIQQVVTHAPERAEPPCEYALKCGGCSLQHMAPSFYKDWKTSRIHDIFTRAEIKPDAWHETIFVSEKTRRRATFTALVQHKKLHLGFREKRSHNILDIKNCLVVTPEIFETIQNMRPFLPRILRDSRVATLFLQDTDSGFDLVISGEVGAKGDPDLPVHEAVAEMINALPIARISWRRKDRDEPQLLLEKNPLHHHFGNLIVTLPSMAFLQPSKDGEAALVRAMRSGIQTALAKMKLEKPLRIADLFAGCGTLTGALTDLGTVIGYESERAPTHALKLGLNKLMGEHDAFIRDLFKEPLTSKELEAFDIIVMDPPRAGAKTQSQMLAELADWETGKILIYISCNGASFARDAKLLVQGGWEFKSAQIIDQFIWSDHTEICGVFTI